MMENNLKKEKSVAQENKAKALSMVLLVLALIAPASHMVMHAMSAKAVLNPDAAGYAVVGRNLASGKGFTTDIVWHYIFKYDDISHPEDSWPVLQPLAIAASILLFGDNVLATHVPNMIYYIILIFSIYIISGRVGGSSWYGLIAALALAFNPYSYNFAVYNNYNDLGFAVYLVWAAYYLWKSVKQDDEVSETGKNGSRKDLILAGVFTGLALLQKTQGVVILLAAIPWFLVKLPVQKIKGCIKSFIIILIVATLFNAPVIIRNFKTFGTFNYKAQPYLNVMHSIAWGRDGPMRWHAILQNVINDPPTYSKMMDKYGKKYILWIVPLNKLNEVGRFFAEGWIIPFPILIFGLLGIYYFHRREKRENWGLLIFLFFAFSMIFPVINHFEERYFFFLVALFCPAFGFGFVETLRKLKTEKSRALLVVVFLATVGFMVREAGNTFYRLQSFKSMEDDRARLYEELKSKTSPDEAVFTFNPFALAYNTGLKTANPPDTDAGKMMKLAKHYNIKYFLAVKDPKFIQAIKYPRSLIKNYSVFLPMLEGQEKYSFTKVFEMEGRYFLYELPPGWRE